MVALTSAKKTVLSPTQTLVDGRLPQPYTTLRRYVLLGIFCLAQFLDAINNSALWSAIPSLSIALDMTPSESTWLISAFQLTFASFLLISGRISDIYNPKVAFIVGVAALGVISLGAGFVRNKIVLIVFRALSGIAASMTIPSALTLIVSVFPKPTEQARAIGLFGGCGSVGSILGLIIGAILVEYANWCWIFWFVAIIALPIALLGIFLIPSITRENTDDASATAKWKNLDIIGVSILTVALILFIFAVTSGSTDGWASAAVLVPLIISVCMVVGFFYYEASIPPSKAAVPPQTWFLPNFAVLFGMSLFPYFWWTTVFDIFTLLWQDIYHWSVISSAIHMFPICITGLMLSFSGPLSRIINPKWIILFGMTMVIVATTLLPFADGPDKYWRFVFPAFAIGSAGAQIAFAHTNIALFRTAPASMAGTVGAIFNGALQLGSAVGIAAVTSIETSIENTHGGVEEYAGRAAAFWFLLAVACVEAVSVALLYRLKYSVPEARDESIVEKASAEDDKGDPTKEKTNDMDNAYAAPALTA